MTGQMTTTYVFKNVTAFFEILIQDCEGMNFNDNSQSGKSQTSNVHDPDVTLIMNTHFASNTDLMNTGFSQKVSSQ